MKWIVLDFFPRNLAISLMDIDNEYIFVLFLNIFAPKSWWKAEKVCQYIRELFRLL